MGRGWGGALMSAAGAGEWRLEALAIEDVTPHYRRIEFHAPGFFESASEKLVFSAGSWIRLWVPDLDDPGREHQRAYTVVASDAEAERLTLEFVLHEPAGPACTWARNAQVGDTLPATRFGIQSFAAPDPPAAGYLLLGDTAGLPGINGIISELPADVPVKVYLEHVYEDDLELPVTPHPRLRVTWVAGSIVRAIEARDYAGWYAWVAGEKGEIKALRSRLKDELGFPGASVKAQAYWTRGKGQGRSRDDAAAVTVTAVPEPVEVAAAATDDAAVAGPIAATWAASAGQQLLAPLKPLVIVAAAVQLLVTLLQLSPFVLLAELCRRVLADDTADLGGLATWALALMGAGGLLALLLVAGMHVVDARFGLEIRRRMVAHLGRLPLGWFDDRSSGLVRKAVHDDAAALHYLVTHAVLDLVAGLVAPLTVLVYLFVVHPGLAGVMLLPLIALYILSLRMYAIAADGVPSLERHEARVHAETVALTDGAAVARVYDLGERSRFRGLLAERTRFIDGWQRPLVGAKTRVDLVTRPTTSLLVLLGAGAPFVMAGWMSPEELVIFLFVGVTFGAQLMAAAFGGQAVRDSVRAAGRIGLLLDEPPLADHREPTAATAVAPAASHAPATVRFDGVTFGYRPDRPVVRDVELTLEAGTTTALVGRSGAGKSTLAALLARFYDVDAGAITVDGVDLRALEPVDLYRRVGFVFQGAGALRASIHDNIALGRPEATREEVEQAARAAQLHERIVRDPRGYDAILGQETWLSGGELQRLAIARTLLADPGVLVLDEATAFADPESEHLIQAAITALAADRTVLVIAHRLGTVAGADRIVVLDGGRIADSGTHAELLGRGGLYHDLWHAGTTPTEVNA